MESEMHCVMTASQAVRAGCGTSSRVDERVVMSTAQLAPLPLISSPKLCHDIELLCVTLCT